MVRYRAAFFPSNERLVQLYTQRAQVVLNARWRAIPQEALLAFRSLGFGADLADARVTCAAALLHHAITSSTVHAAWGKYDPALASDGAALVA